MRVISFTVVNLTSILRWSEKNEHFRHIFIFYFRKGKNAAQAAKKLRDVYGEEVLKARQCRNWFDKSRLGDFSLKDEQRSGRPIEVDDQIKAIIESDRHVTVREIEQILKIPKSTINRHIQRLGLVKKLDIFLFLQGFYSGADYEFFPKNTVKIFILNSLTYVTKNS